MQGSNMTRIVQKNPHDFKFGLYTITVLSTVLSFILIWRVTLEYLCYLVGRRVTIQYPTVYYIQKKWKWHWMLASTTLLITLCGIHTLGTNSINQSIIIIQTQVNKTQWRRKFFSEGGLTGSIESQVAGGLGGCAPQTLKLFQFYVVQSSPKSTFRCNLKYLTKIPSYFVVGV